MTKPRVSDAQVRLNQQPNWLAIDVVFASLAALKAGAEPKGQRYTYKALTDRAPTAGKLTHVPAGGGLQSAHVAEVRKPTAEDHLVAHAWIIPDGCYRTYEACVAADAKYLEAFAAAERAAKLEEDLRASLERTEEVGTRVRLAAHVKTKAAPFEVRLGGSGWDLVREVK